MVGSHSIRATRPCGVQACGLAGLLLAVGLASATRAAEPAAPKPTPAAATPAAAEPGPGPEAPPAPPRKLFEQSPFDTIKLDKANNYIVLKVLPLPFPNRRLPDKPKRVGKLRVRLLDKQDADYDVAWRNIDSIEFFEEQILAETEKIVAQAVDLISADKPAEAHAKYDEAFEWYQALLTYYPQTPGLQESVQAYLYGNAGVLFKLQRVAEACAVLEELYRLNKDYRHQGGAQTVVAALDRAGDRLLASYADAGNFGAARQILERLSNTYGDALKSVGEWRTRLDGLATQKREEAAAHLEAKRFREAHDSSREMLNIWPRVAGGRELVLKIANQYPLVVVGVSQLAAKPEALRLDDWAARRTGYLIQQPLLRFVEAGPEGGLYSCPFATVQCSDNRKQVTFDLTAGASGMSPGTLSGYLLSLADPDSQNYSLTWAAIMGGVQPADGNRLTVDLRRPHVLPQAFLQTPLTSGGQPVRLYAATSQNEQEVRYEPVPSVSTPASLKPVMIERQMPDPRKALEALRRGKVDILDRLLPRDAQRLAQDPELTVGRYRFPTLHVLVPNRSNPFLGSRAFRRAVVYGINRKVILELGLLDKQELKGCRVLSAPLPAGLDDNDASAYAYDARIAPLPYDPVMATVLSRLAEQQLSAAADQRQESAPELKELILAHPAGELPRFACQKIQTQLQAVGIKCKLRELPAGQVNDPQRKYDLLYLELAMYEPLADVGRVFGPQGILASADPYLTLALTQIERAENWKTARERFQELHRLLFEDVTVIPLWQIVEQFACHRGLQGLRPRPANFYQDSDQWRVIPPEPK